MYMLATQIAWLSICWPRTPHSYVYAGLAMQTAWLCICRPRKQHSYVYAGPTRHVHACADSTHRMAMYMLATHTAMHILAMHTAWLCIGWPHRQHSYVYSGHTGLAESKPKWSCIFQPPAPHKYAYAGTQTSNSTDTRPSHLYN